METIEKKDLWEIMIDKLDGFKPSQVPRGIMPLIDLISQINNGGVQQAVFNEFDFKTPIMLAGLIGQTGKEFAGKIKRLTPNPLDMSRQDIRDMSGDYPDWETFEKWFYCVDNGIENKMTIEITQFLNSRIK